MTRAAKKRFTIQAKETTPVSRQTTLQAKGKQKRNEKNASVKKRK